MARQPLTDPQDRRSGRRGLWLRRTLLVSFSLLGAFAVAEVGARLRFGVPLRERLPLVSIEANPYRGWQMVPGEDHYTYLHLAEINSMGFRSPEIEARREGEVRVLALGDSLTYGQGVAGDETIPAILQAELAAHDSREERTWTVINSGHRGYNTTQQVGLLEEWGARLDLDVVVLLWFWNDLNVQNVDEIYRKRSASGPIHQDVRAPMEGTVKRAWQAVQLARRSAFLMQLRDALRSAEDRDYGPLIEQGLEQQRRDLARLRELVEKLEVRFLIAMLPEPGEIRKEHPSTGIAARAMALMEEQGLQVVSLLDPVRDLYEQTGELPILPYDGHYDASGNRAMAAALAPMLLELVGE